MASRSVRWRPSRPTLPTLLTLALTAVLAAVAAASAPLWGRAPYVPSTELPLTALIAVFAVPELVVLHVQVRREAQTVSLSELVTVLALFFASPGQLLLARAVSCLAVCVLHRRSPWLKTAFNTALFTAEAAVAVVVFGLLSGSPAGAPGPRSWAAAAAAVLLSGAVGVFALQLVVAAHEGGLELRAAAREAVVGQALTLLLTSVALVAVLALAVDPSSSWLLPAPAVALLLAYRAHARLSDRHLRLERLYRFSQVVTSSPEVDAVLRSVLAEARELLRAEHVVVRFLPAGTGRAALQLQLDRDGVLERTELTGEADPAWLQAAVVAEGRSVLARRGSRTPSVGEWLAGQGWRQAVVVPLRGEAGVIGTLRVADRLGEAGAFGAADVQLLERVAEHAGASLQNGRLVDQLRHDALHDALTGLANRVQLQRVLAEAVAEVAAGRRAGATVMVLDLDGFKDVNDSLGHAAGDRLLQEVSSRLVAAVGPAGVVARLGGDEFSVVLPATAAQSDVLAAGGQVLQALRAPIDLDGMLVSVGGSLGIALAPAHGTDGPALLKCADTAMYEAKSSAGGLRVYQVDREADDPRRRALVPALREALADGSVGVHLQPVAELGTGTVRRAEAFVRWVHPELGEVRPDELLPAADRGGLLGALTSHVLDRALTACADWYAAGHELGVSVNIGIRSLVDHAFVAEVRERLARHDVPAGRLTLEIAEPAVMSDPQRAVVLMGELRALGVRLSLDDFGTGNSSLAYLTQLPIDEVKIDKSFVRRLCTRSDDVAVVRSVAELGRGLRLDVVAEGVEDHRTWQVLRTLGCSHAQGWYLGRSMPAAALPAWLAEHTLSSRVPETVAP